MASGICSLGCCKTMFEFFTLCLFIVEEQIIYVLKWAMLLCEVLFMPQLFFSFFTIGTT